MVIMEKRGNNLKALLELAGITQAELAERLDITPQQVCNWAAGRGPSPESRQKIAQELGMERDEFTSLLYAPGGREMLEVLLKLNRLTNQSARNRIIAAIAEILVIYEATQATDLPPETFDQTLNGIHQFALMAQKIISLMG